MNIPAHDERHPLSTLSPAQLAALHEAAKRRALELRREAINAFWSAVARRLRRVFGARSGLGTGSISTRGGAPRPGRA